MGSRVELQLSGPERELWSLAAVRERFRAGELLSAWLRANVKADRETIQAAKRAALKLQEVAKPALGADGLPAHRLGMSERLDVLRTIGVEAVRAILDQTPRADLTEAEALLAQLLSGGVALDMQDRNRLVALSQVLPMASAAGAPVGIDAEALRQHLDNLDFLSVLGGADLHRFVGRADELGDLRATWDLGGYSSVFVLGPGGIGKSMLVSHFIASVLETPEARPTAVFHIDFDRRDMQSTRPALVLSEMLRQMSRWVGPDMREAARRLAVTAQRTQTQEFQGQSRSVESTGQLADYRMSSLVELLESSGEVRVIIFADSAEQVFGFDDVAADSPARVAEDLWQSLARHAPELGRPAQVMLIYGARFFPPTWTHNLLPTIILDTLSPDEAKAYLRAEAARFDASIGEEVFSSVIAAVGRAPLALRLAAKLLATEDARTDPRNWVTAVRDDPERVQAMLYDRVLKRLRDPDLRRLAKPGLLLRRITPVIVADVLAGPCGLDPTKLSPDRLIAESAREGQLFFRDVSDPDPQALWHRPDVRALMLPDLDAAIDPELAAAINTAAVGFYAGREDAVSRAEELYHRLRLDQPAVDLSPRWTDAAGVRLKNALDELPARARDFVRGRLGAASLAEVEARIDGPGPYRPDAEAQLLGELRGVVRRELQRGAAPIATLIRYNADTLKGVLGDVYAEALVASGRIDTLLSDARDLLAHGDVAPPGVRAAVCATTAGVLEGRGDLGEALVYWTEARRPSPEPDEEFALTELGGAIGWLRTCRKLGLEADRKAELKQLARRIEAHASALVSRPVLLREVVAELGDLLVTGRKSSMATYRRLLNVLFDIEEAFPSAVADPARLLQLSQRLGVGPVSSLRMLNDVAAKQAYRSSKYAGRLVLTLREEVEWTLVMALSRSSPKSPEAYAGSS